MLQIELLSPSAGFVVWNFINSDSKLNRCNWRIQKRDLTSNPYFRILWRRIRGFCTQENDYYNPLHNKEGCRLQIHPQYYGKPWYQMGFLIGFPEISMTENSIYTLWLIQIFKVNAIILALLEHPSLWLVYKDILIKSASPLIHPSRQPTTARSSLPFLLHYTNI